LKAHSFKLAEPPVTESIGLIELRSPIKPSPGRPGNHDRNAAMTDKESLTGIEQDVQIEERTRHAMETYVNWLQNAMSASPWSNVDLNKKLLSYATENVTAAVGLVEKLSHAKNLEDVVKIQTEFMSKQLGSLNEQTKAIREICMKAAQAATKRSN
jgi:hypothetical protein